MNANTSHDLASVTKAVGTTASLLRLVSEGLVKLDSEVRRYLPGFRGPIKDSITVRDLLLHRAGLKEWYPLYAAVPSIDEAHRLVETLPLVCPPRTSTLYSDLGFILLGRIVAVSAGQDLASATAELVTQPLRLGSTRYAHPIDLNIATGARDDRIEASMIDAQIPYAVPFDSADFSGWRREPIHGQVADGNAYHMFGSVSGHAGLFSTVPDLLQFGAALSDFRSHDSLWHPEIVQEFFTTGSDDRQAHGFRRYKMNVNGEELSVLGHSGHVGCAIGFVPDRGIALALASNRLLVDTAPIETETLWAELLGLAGTEIGLFSL